MNSTKMRKFGGAAGLVAGGLITGGILAGTLAANAAEDTTTPTTGSESSKSQTDPSQPQRSDEQLLTGDTKTQVEAAVLAEYPGATIERAESDSDGVYESHVVTTDGDHLIVQVGEDFAVTGTDSGGHGGHGGPRGDAPDSSDDD
ncbi:hypothetical protein SAMN05661080_03876 [Modestobacter sp. DSM 44400]|uniref:hypothetical protein n=1 Tax=Modestobacter sp. DSM 44400 TaxID=1550230 RepID=UPI0008973083|nr:hypothetical protein [Modestobacter sp. DSM 44400]SDY56539.1 hypothetical protein SAMN05661080_03876 [Modestobacter sp. DSM 44400]